MNRVIWTALLVVGTWILVGAGLVARTPASPWPWLTLERPPNADETPPLAEGPEKEHRRVPSVDLASMFPGLVILRGAEGQRQVALTFDDGPDETYTPQVLEVLKQEGVRATFFLVGSRVEELPGVARRIAAEGHAVGNHGFHHVRYSALSRAQIITDLGRADDALHRATGQRPRLFRPPYGALDPHSVRAITDQGYRVIMWSIDSRDWQAPGSGRIIDTVLGSSHDGAIILLHSGGGPGQDLSGTVKALPAIIQGLRDRGYEMVTVPGLLRQLGKDAAGSYTTP